MRPKVFVNEGLFFMNGLGSSVRNLNVVDCLRVRLLRAWSKGRQN